MIAYFKECWPQVCRSARHLWKCSWEIKTHMKVLSQSEICVFMCWRCWRFKPWNVYISVLKSLSVNNSWWIDLTSPSYNTLTCCVWGLTVECKRTFTSLFYLLSVMSFQNVFLSVSLPVKRDHEHKNTSVTLERSPLRNDNKSMFCHFIFLKAVTSYWKQKWLLQLQCVKKLVKHSSALAW